MRSTFFKIPLLVSLPIVLSLTACGPGTMKTKPSAQPSGDLDVVKSSQKLAVPYFRVNFIKHISDMATAGGGMFQQGAATRLQLVVKLNGVSDETYQKITDEAYDDLNNKLSKSKYKLASKTQLLAAPQYQKIKLEYPDIDSDESIHIPTGTKYPNGFTVGLRYGEVIQDLEATTLLVDYTVNFVNLDKEAQHRAGWNSSSNNVKISAAPLVQVGGVVRAHAFSNTDACKRMSQACVGKTSQLQLSSKHTSTTFIGELTETTNKTASALLGAVNFLSKLQGSSTRDLSKFTLNADEKAYHDAVLEALKSANTELVSKLP